MKNKIETKIDEKFLQDLSEYVSFKSISTDKTYLGEIEKQVFWLKRYIENVGGRVELFQEGETNPVVYGEFIVDTTKETVLLYGHYDVQPAEKEDGWSTAEPFLLEEKSINKVNRLVGRGIVDNKGQNFIHLFTIAKLFQEKKLKYNVKILLEGNEESGNDDLPKILKKNKNKFTCDYALVSDGEIVKDFPVCESSLRGGGNIKVTITTGKNNLHSGIFGGAVPSASFVLSQLLAKLKDKNNKVLVPDFYKNILTPTKSVLENNKSLGTDKRSQETAGVKKLLTLKNYDFYTQTGCLPTLEISGIKSGYIGEGFANIVPATAEARINIRVVPNQKIDKVLASVKKFILQNTPSYAKVEVEMESHGDSIKLDSECEVAENVKKILKESYGKKVLNKYVGGSIPILGDFQKILNTKVISVSLGNEDCNMHGVDENFRVDLVEKGLKFADKFWRR